MKHFNRFFFCILFLYGLDLLLIILFFSALLILMYLNRRNERTRLLYARYYRR